MTAIPTTTFGSWANITTYSLTPAQYVTDGMGDYACDYDGEAVVGELLTELQAELPAGLTILGNGELIGPAYGPEHDALPEDVCDHVAVLLAGIDLAEILDRHDLTERAAAFLVYPIGDDGQRIGDPIDRGAIDSPETAHQLLRDLDSDLSAEDFGAEPDSQFDAVIVDGEDNELRCERVYAR